MNCFLTFDANETNPPSNNQIHRFYLNFFFLKFLLKYEIQSHCLCCFFRIMKKIAQSIESFTYFIIISASGQCHFLQCHISLECATIRMVKNPLKCYTKLKYRIQKAVRLTNFGSPSLPNAKCPWNPSIKGAKQYGSKS